jgi:ribosomal protein S5
MANGTVGKVVQVLGAVIDCEFPADHMPSIFNAVKIRRDDSSVAAALTGGGVGKSSSKLNPELVLEVEQHIGNNWVRCVAMDTTDGIRRGMDAVDTGAPISVPVGEPTLGRLFNVIGEPTDENGPVISKDDVAIHRLPIHRLAPTFQEQATKTEMFETGIKVIDLVAPFTKGGKTASWSILVVVGDNKGRVGVGIGKARGIPDAIRKAEEAARRDMFPVPMIGSTIPHEIRAVSGTAQVMLRPAAPGTGVKAGGAVRACLEACGIHDVLAKSLGSRNAINMAYATIAAFELLLSPEEVAQRRNIDVKRLTPWIEKARKEEADAAH